MTADSDAFEIVKQLPGLTPAEQQYLLTVARGEAFYGLGWGSPNPKTISDSKTLGIDPKAGVGSNNWGAVQGTGNAGFFPHVDYHSNGIMYLGTFKKYAIAADGASDIAKVLLKANVRNALSKGDMRGAVYAQHDNRYYELAPDKYLSAVSKNYDILTRALQWPKLLSLNPPTITETIAAHPLVSGFLSSDWEPTSSGELSKVLDAADAYLKDDDWQEGLKLPVG